MTFSMLTIYFVTCEFPSCSGCIGLLGQIEANSSVRNSDGAFHTKADGLHALEHPASTDMKIMELCVGFETSSIEIRKHKCLKIISQPS